jgi:fructosamine-3-kinase
MSIKQRIHEILGLSVQTLTPLSGGCVAEVTRADLDDGRSVVIKTGTADSGLDLEGRMLRYLGKHTALPVPEVYHAENALLIMSWLPSGGTLNGPAQEHAADLMANLHKISNPDFGFEMDTVIGGLAQPNPRSPSWVSFFRDQRLLYMAGECTKINALPLNIMTRLEKFSTTLPDLLLEPEAPSLIHGDLWGGNVLCRNNKVTGLIDPALYYAHAEIELAFTTLFSTFGDRFFARYQEHRPIAPGFFEERLDIYNLYPLLVHVRLFGGHYVSQVDRTLQRFGC